MNACIQCNEASSYKCPICRKPYCSVACCKLHRETPCTAPEIPKVEPPKEPMTFDFPTEDTVPIEKLELLKQSSEVKACLDNPHVRTILELLDKSPHPDQLIQEYMQEPIFTEFVDACLKVVQPPENDE
ncbi:zinc finger HIT domain-containing protein 3 [Ostrinia nubilalis]|uniref:zinc finger HIT domain-containing protein 3 n=1 Tax=Ostrinia nubilalis TaxID=29057 RepID=UPI0030823B5D